MKPIRRTRVDATQKEIVKIKPRGKPPIRDLTNFRIGKLTALYPSGRAHGGVVWICKCDCGRQISRSRANLMRGRHSTSCGCARFIVSEIAKCPICGKEFLARYRKRDGRLQQTCSIECSFSHRNISGERNPNWKDNATIKNLGGRFTNAYKKWREVVINRDGACCCCGSIQELQADHIEPWSKFPESRFLISNGQTLCKTCHIRKTRAQPVKYARKRDTSEAAIVEALRKIGCFVYLLDQPCDLLIYRTIDRRWFTMECKSPRNKKGDPKLDKRQKEQGSFISLTNTPYITSPAAAVSYILGAR